MSPVAAQCVRVQREGGGSPLPLELCRREPWDLQSMDKGTLPWGSFGELFIKLGADLYCWAKTGWTQFGVPACPGKSVPEPEAESNNL